MDLILIGQAADRLGLNPEVDLVGRQLHSQLTMPAGATAGQWLDRAQHLLHRAVVPIMPMVTPAAGTPLSTGY